MVKYAAMHYAAASPLQEAYSITCSGTNCACLKTVDASQQWNLLNLTKKFRDIVR